jgi:hypothetical protein
LAISLLYYGPVSAAELVWTDIEVLEVIDLARVEVPLCEVPMASLNVTRSSIMPRPIAPALNRAVCLRPIVANELTLHASHGMSAPARRGWMSPGNVADSDVGRCYRVLSHDPRRLGETNVVRNVDTPPIKVQCSPATPTGLCRPPGPITTTDRDRSHRPHPSSWGPCRTK